MIEPVNGVVDTTRSWWSVFQPVTAWRVPASVPSAAMAPALPTPDELAVRALAQRLGISEAEIEAERSNGKSLGQVARENGVPREEALAAVVRQLPPLPGNSQAALRGVAADVIDARPTGGSAGAMEAAVLGAVSPGLVARALPPLPSAAKAPRR